MADDNQKAKADVGKKKEDFEFAKILGEGSYSTVVLAKDKSNGQKYAMKILEKKHIIKEKKVAYVNREKEVLSKIKHPLFVRLYFTFQDSDKLYFGLSFAERGEITPYLRKVGCFDETCTKFYTAEIVEALDYLHQLRIIHRDLKPENILLNEQWHVQITDFGTAKVLEPGSSQCRADSFVGTAEYVSPELLTSKNACYASDLWALGCILFQFTAGFPPFHGANEYQCFQKITKGEYSIPDGFPAPIADLIEKILILEPTERLGAEEKGGFGPLKQHDFFEDIKWDTLMEQKPPPIKAYLPGQDLHSDMNVLDGMDADGQDDFDGSLLLAGLGLADQSKPLASQSDDRKALLAKQESNSPWSPFCNGELILKAGLVDKRKGFSCKRRQLICTDGPHLYYVDPVAMVLKGEIPWSEHMQLEMKNFKTFFIHTPNRTYFLEDPSGEAQQWVTLIENLQKKKKSVN
ncbi:3-phosphoinositide-dependent protein kinase 1-like [Sycon ciliatum]|uniref:3-phosphoinositide-dependent protein kinase 1-like n=1 Tax=Sycon ciliatum TaxID=27933 RepID=UPI0020A8F1BF|eukprot:scpid53186/ scgid28318/ 3-phosphoinositide-dependent protein kinase 1